MPPNGFWAVRSGSGNSASLLDMLSGPIKIKWMRERGKIWLSWSHTSRGREDSARAPRMNNRTGGALSRRPWISTPSPDFGGCKVYRNAEGIRGKLGDLGVK